MSDEKMPNKFLENLVSMITMDNIQKYLLGYKKSGQNRAVYDVVKDYTKPQKKKRKGKDGRNSHSLYLSIKKNKKKKKDKDKYWHF